MKILIIYATHGGVSGQCAEMLEKKLKDRSEVTLVNALEARTLPTPECYDVAVIGGPVRYGRIDKVLRVYLKNNLEALNKIRAAFFYCCGFPADAEEYIDTQFPKTLEFSLGVHCFGGEIKPEKLKGFDKLIVRMIRSHIRSQDFEESDDYHAPLPEILPESIERLAEAIIRA